jgi:hypothetical protein
MTADIGVPMQISMWREQDAMRQSAISFGVIPRSFHDENNRFCLIAAVIINCDFRGADAFQAKACPDWPPVPVSETPQTKNNWRKIECPTP